MSLKSESDELSSALLSYLTKPISEQTSRRNGLGVDVDRMSAGQVLQYEYRLKRELDRIKQRLCKHDGETYVSADWSYTHRCCSQCHKVLEDLRQVNTVK